MSYRIIADSSCELPEELLNTGYFHLVPFGLEISGEHLVDDESMDISELLKKIEASPECPKSSCPSPQLFMDRINSDAEHIYIITISSKLSGSYNSAVLAKSMYEEEHDDKKICVIDSKSASCGESQIAMLAHELEQQGLPFEEISSRLEQYRDQLETCFVLDNLETLRKNGRLSGVKALVASTLSIKPVLVAKEGEIAQVSQGIGIRKALGKLVEEIIKRGGELTKKRIIITHCNNLSRAEEVKKLIENKIGTANIMIMATKGLSSLYANDGGIIVTF